MSNQKHTPGPWIVSSSKTAVLSLTPVEMQNQKPCPVVVDCASGYDAMDYEEAKANARLIAASPDLISSLVEIMSSYPGSMLDKDIKARAYAAIAKARGE